MEVRGGGVRGAYLVRCDHDGVLCLLCALCIHLLSVKDECREGMGDSLSDVILDLMEEFILNGVDEMIPEGSHLFDIPIDSIILLPIGHKRFHL